MDRIVTEWGFRGADAPVIRSERNGEVWSYYLAEVRNDDDE
jgi:hypothetical protein